MAADQSMLPASARRPRWRFFVQFSLRTLLVFITLAAVTCWWFLQPKTREEQFRGTPLRLRRQVRLKEIGPPGKNADLERDVIVEQEKYFVIVDVGHWRLFDQSQNLLVDGRYENDEPHGKWTTYHTNGRKAAEGVVARGVKEGPWKTWDEEGRLLSDVMYPKQKR